MAWTRLLTVVAMLAVLALPFVPAWAATDAAGVAAAADSLPTDIGDDPAPDSTEAEALAPVLVVDLHHDWPGPPGRLGARHSPSFLAGPVAPPPRGLRAA